MAPYYTVLTFFILTSACCTKCSLNIVENTANDHHQQENIIIGDKSEQGREATKRRFGLNSAHHWTDQEHHSHYSHQHQHLLHNNNHQHFDQDKPPVSDNEINNNDQVTFGSASSSAHKSQQEYVCGRAIANKKYKDLLLRDQSYLMSTTRTKYRPIEIRMPRIIGGDETAPGEFPWTVSVKLNSQPICGGSLIDKSWVLTAAHCVVGYNPKNLTVRLGAYRIKDQSETQTVDLPVSMFIVHKEYSMPRPFSNDIALLKMNEPVEYTDFIIPICLPTEDQISTSSSANTIVNDYSNNQANRFGVTRDQEEDDSGGIVVSTKMSDNDIAKCFSRIEQNYLNSIGLGAEHSSTSSSSSDQPAMMPQKQHHHHQQSSPSSSPLLAAPPTGPQSAPARESQSVGQAGNTPNSHLITYGGGILEPIFMTTTNNHNKNPSTVYASLYNSPNRVTDSSNGMADGPMNGQNNNNNNKITFFPQENFGGQDFDSQTFLSSAQSQLNSIESSQISNQNNNIYYGLRWSGRSSNGDANVERPVDSRAEMIKLSRLPISKELLREIQSVGSNSMAALNLELQQDDFVAMANDLTTKPSGNADRERVITTGVGGGHKPQMMRTTTSNVILDPPPANTLDDDPTKYSGLSGIVVGWGWVREIDGEDQIQTTNNKGYPSVTLQKVKLPILRNNVCESWFQSQSKKITLLPSQFCAGFSSGGKDACRGDSGGPMIIEDNSDTGRYKLIGIVSAGIGCARPSLPGLYTRVASFLPWINAQMVRY